MIKLCALYSTCPLTHTHTHTSTANHLNLAKMHLANWIKKCMQKWALSADRTWLHIHWLDAYSSLTPSLPLHTISACGIVCMYGGIVCVYFSVYVSILHQI